MTQGGSRVMQQRRLRVELRRIRERAGRTQKVVADSLGWSTSKVIRIETGAVHVSTSDVMALLHYYGVNENTEELLALSRAKEQSWWDTYRSYYKQPFLDFLAYEDSAVRLRQFIGSVVPGLLQTEDYMRALFTSNSANDADQIERAMHVRARRQAILDPDRGCQASFLIDEAGLHRWVGGPAVARAQLDRLREAARQPNISIRVVPFSAGMHPGMFDEFTIFDFASEDEDTVVNVEEHNRAQIREEPEITSQYLEHYFVVEELATPEDELDAVLDSVLEGIRLDT